MINGIDLDEKINEFLQRKDAQFPGINLFGRGETRTIKHVLPHLSVPSTPRS